MYMYWQWQIYQIWGLAASGSRSRNLKRSYPACPKNKKNPPPSILYYNIHLLEFNIYVPSCLFEWLLLCFRL